MNRVRGGALLLAGVAIFLSCSSVSSLQAQNPAPPAPAPNAQAPAKPAEPAKEPEAEQNPFAPEPAPALPPGMSGSDVNDPRYKLKPGLNDAGEVSMGLKHLLLVKKPDAFQLGSDNPDDPKVQSTLGQLGIGNSGKMPKPLQLVIAQLAFANSDVAFQANHLFQGNFSGIDIFDISDPAKTQLLTTLVCPGGQGDVSVYKNLLFMSVEMPNGRLDCGTRDSRRSLRRPPERKRSLAHPPPRRIASAECVCSISRTSRTRSRSQRYRPAVARTRTHWSSTPMTRTTFISTSPAHRSCVSRKSWMVAQADRRIRTRTRLCSASTSSRSQSPRHRTRKSWRAPGSSWMREPAL